MCALAIALWGCGDDSANPHNPHLPGPSDAMDAPHSGDGAGIDAMADAAPVLTCGMGGPEVAPLPPSGSVSGGAPVGAGMFAGSCGGGSGAEAIYYVRVTVPLSAVTFSTDLPQTTSQPILYVRTTCDQTSSEVGCMASTTTAKATVTVQNPPMGTIYYIFIDEPSASPPGIYALTVSGNIAEGQVCDPANQAFTCGPRHLCVERVAGMGPHCEIARCADGMDNDGDGKIDFPHDPGCTAFEDDDETDDCGNAPPAGPNCPQCGNHIDDDGDGKIDYDPPAGSMSDPGCSSASDPSEIDECIPGVMVSEFDTNGHATGDTSTQANHFAPTTACVFEALGPDQVLHYRVDQPTRQVTATMVPTGGTFNDPILYIRKNMCGDLNSQDGCATAISGQVQATATNLAVGNDLYFFADGEFATGSAGAFTMQLDVQLDFQATCNPAVTWKHCGTGLKCQNNTCVKTQCADGIDNDGDMWIDYPNDPGCQTLDDDSENSDTCRTNPTGPGNMCPQCGNGIDDDGDGLIDYPADPGCSSRADNDESDDCFPMMGQPGVMVTDITGMTDVVGTTCPAGVTCPGTCTAGTNCGVFTSDTCATFSTGPEKVYLYRLTAPATSMTATTCNNCSASPCPTDFDTVVYIRKQTCINSAGNAAMNEVVCDDDNGSMTPPAGTCGTSEGLQSYVHTGPLMPGNYFIFVDGYSTNMGHFHLHVSVTP
jgi:hypothetical protein